ncbi:peptide ABC transporter substrate-binding protein [Desulfosporosinus sp. Sb-LF]|uniref:peptide ABC transporter substrate-binding protein n=1 Tax=Desulfosporosinus sp. Sb-LF TaxID=2560027 RepID=UPI00107F232E|nr:peptide ABC transporter substrate-binding protein [Desulfosporosinus sp. Sb-LF]TGE32351.1 peptide ABC transporter substrate-binding protein [Desulfosporosinus sp. Sb-LF]
MFRKNKLGVMILAATLMLSITVTGCGTGGSATPTPAKEMKTSYNSGAEPKTLDPQMSNGIPEAIDEMNLFEGLTRLDKNNVAQPAIAEKIDVSSDGLKYTFHLRDSKFSNGDPLTAEDFKFSWMHAMDPASAAEYAYQVADYIKGGAAYNAKTGKAEDVGIKVIDPKTLEVTLENPTPYFMALTAFPTYYPVDKKVVEANKDWNLKAETFVSNGPFKMKSWAHNDKIVLVKNDNYWDAKSVKLTELTLSLIEDRKAALTAYEAGQIDGVDNGVPADDVDRLVKSGDLKVEPQIGTYYYRFNVTKKPYDDPRVRQALAMAIDRKKIVDTVQKTGEKSAFAFTPYGINDADTSKQFRDVGGDYFKEDLSKAKQLLADAGFPDGKGFPEIKILFNSDPNHEKIATIIQDMWSKNLGIKATLRPEEWKVYQESEQKLNYDVARAAWVGDYLDPMTFLDMFVKNGGNNQTGWANPQYDSLIAAAKKNADSKTRMQQLHDAEKILMTEMPVMPINFYLSKYTAKSYVKGVIHSPLGMVDFKTATVEK